MRYLRIECLIHTAILARDKSRWHSGCDCSVGESKTNEHFFRSSDGKAGLWFGDVDDLWRLGLPQGIGGPWKQAPVIAGTPSDPYLMTGYDKKALELSHDAKEPVSFIVEVDFLADDSWAEYARFTVAPEQKFQHSFPKGYSAHWVRLRIDRDAKATALFTHAGG